jgi:hypothetical protein
MAYMFLEWVHVHDDGRVMFGNEQLEPVLGKNGEIWVMVPRYANDPKPVIRAFDIVAAFKRNGRDSVVAFGIASILGSRPPSGREMEDAFVATWHGRAKVEEIAKVLGVSRKRVYDRTAALKLGLA